jgi:hypothetical protein
VDPALGVPTVDILSPDFITTGSRWKQEADIGVHPDTTEPEIVSGDNVFFLLNHWVYKPFPILGSYKSGLSICF